MEAEHDTTVEALLLRLGLKRLKKINKKKHKERQHSIKETKQKQKIGKGEEN